MQSGFFQLSLIHPINITYIIMTNIYFFIHCTYIIVIWRIQPVFLLYVLLRIIIISRKNETETHWNGIHATLCLEHISTGIQRASKNNLSRVLFTLYCTLSDVLSITFMSFRRSL